MIQMILDGAQTVLLGYAAGCVVALCGFVRALWKGEVF